MSQDSEKKKLLGEGDEPTGVSPPPKYDDSPPEPEPPSYQQVEEPDSTSSRPHGKVMGYLYDHRATIPGYGMIQMIRGVSIYSLYVLLALLLAYLLNQLDRYTLPIVTTSAGYDLQYGDRSCMKNRNLSMNEFADNRTSICTNETYFDVLYNETINVK